MTDFFISYNKADRDWAVWIAWVLEENGYECIIQDWDFQTGSNFIVEMDRAAKECGRTVVVLSPDYLTSLYTQPEWAAAFAKDPTGKDRRLIPLRVRDCALDGLLAQIVYRDLTAIADEDGAHAEVLAAVAEGRAKPANRPRFPKAKAAPKPPPRFPNTPAEFHNLPTRNPHFTGRVELLGQIRGSLANGREVALTALNGLGGVGKSQTALEYAWRHRADYCVMWWIKAERLETMLGDLAALGTCLGLAGSDDLTGNARAALAALSGQTGWLLVYDNVESEDSVADWLPREGGHVILTSRHAVWHNTTSVNVTTLTEAEAVAFLLERTKDTNSEAAKDLANDLGCLPLALEQAAAFMVEQAWSLRRYLETFRKRRAELLKLGKPQHYPDTIATTWAMAFEAVEKASPAAAQLLILCAHLAPDDIPLDLLRVGAEKLPEQLASVLADELTASEAVTVLRRYSLVTAKDDSLSIHRLVQEMVRDRLSEDQQKEWVEWTVRCVRKAFPYKENDLATWPPSARLLPHAEAAAALAVKLDAAGRATADLMIVAGQHLNRQGLYRRAASLMRQAFTLAERHWPTNDPNVAIAASELGTVLRQLGDLEGAKNMHQIALAIREAAYSPDHYSVAVSAGNLGAALYALGNFAEARKLFERALIIDEAICGSDHPSVAIDAGNLGLVLQELGDHAGARTRQKQALAIEEKIYGPNHPNVAARSRNIGALSYSEGDIDGAQRWTERALRIDEEAFAPGHPIIAENCQNLGMILWKQRALAAAHELFTRAVSIAMAGLGADHPHTKIYQRSLANLEANIARQKGK